MKKKLNKEKNRHKEKRKTLTKFKVNLKETYHT